MNIRALLLVGALLGTSPLQADPMRPLTPVAGSAAASAPKASTPRADNSAQPTIQAERLVAIRRDSQGRRQALLGEQWLALGERLRSAGSQTARADAPVVSALTDTSVTLQQGRQQLVLQLLPQLVASTEAAATGTSTATAATTATRRTFARSTSPTHSAP